jgi:hypothetical protein
VEPACIPSINGGHGSETNREPIARRASASLQIEGDQMTRRLNHIFAVPPIIASMGGLYVGYFARWQKERVAAAFLKSAKFGALLGFISAAALIIEVGEDLRRSTNGEYWNWLRDFPFACKILLAETAASTFAGLVASAVFVIAPRSKPAPGRGAQVEPDLSWLAVEEKAGE